MDINKDKVLTREEREIAIEEKMNEIVALTNQDLENLAFVSCLFDRKDDTGAISAVGSKKNIVVALFHILAKEELKDCLQVALKLLSANKDK